jgi:YegS/Rv2252/BmrU family lipid kinase
MARALVVLNPIAGRGNGARSELEIRRLLTAEGLTFDLVRTEGHGHAAELAEQAVCDGYNLVVAAGGDGTFHEVVNGLMSCPGQEGVVGTMGVLPVGSGSDFANTVGVPFDLRGGCSRVVRGTDRVVDVGRVWVDGGEPEYFDNTVNIGFGGVVTREARKVQRLTGTALYLPVVLKTVFLFHRAPDVTISCDGRDLDVSAVMICIANGRREGGAFLVAPEASPDDGVFDVCVVREIGRLRMLSMIPSFMNGTHCEKDPVQMMRGARIAVTSQADLIAHVDGEMLCTEGHRIDFEVVPRSLRVRC